MKQDQANHAMWAAIEKIAQKTKRRDLVPACQEEFALRIVGRIGRMAVDRRATGSITVADDGEMAKSIAPDAAHVLALVLAAAPKTRRTALLEELPEKLRRDGELPGVEPERMAEAKAMLKSLRRTDTVPKKGNVTVAFGLD